MPALSVNELSCQELVELVTAYLDGAMPAPDRLRFDAHLAGCRGCQAYLHQMQQMIKIVGRLTEAGVPQTGKQRLLDAFRSWKASAG
jgi:anti-sigma factor RsiW